MTMHVMGVARPLIQLREEPEPLLRKRQGTEVHFDRLYRSAKLPDSAGFQSLAQPLESWVLKDLLNTRRQRQTLRDPRDELDCQERVAPRAQRSHRVD